MENLLNIQLKKSSWVFWGFVKHGSRSCCQEFKGTVFIFRVDPEDEGSNILPKQ
jgi:hypothetical protein